LYGATIIRGHHAFHLNLPGDHTSTTRDSYLKKNQYHSQA
jgi:hypothetical protein